MLEFIKNYILIPQVDAAPSSVALLISRVNEHVINPLISLLFVVALIIFVVGLFSFFKAKGSGSDEGIEKGKRHLTYGVIGMLVMVSVFGIMQFLISSLGVKGIQTPDNESTVNLDQA